MARGARERFGTDYAAAVSGVAGPGGGTEDKPVGTVWLAVVGPEEAQITRKLSWPGNREQIRRLAAFAAMALLLRMVRGRRQQEARQ
jgi:nicotinamide-nucleotide amidase